MLYLWSHRAQSTMVWSFDFWRPLSKNFRQVWRKLSTAWPSEHHAAGPNAQLQLVRATTQWRTQKIFVGEVHSVAYGGHLYLMCTVCDVTIWRHIHVCTPTFHNLQLENQAAPMSPVGAVEHRECAAGLAGAHPGLQDRILQNYTRIENA